MMTPLERLLERQIRLCWRKYGRLVRGSYPSLAGSVLRSIKVLESPLAEIRGEDA